MGEQMPWSDCADVQADQCLRSPQMLKDTFLYGTVQLSYQHWDKNKGKGST